MSVTTRADNQVHESFAPLTNAPAGSSVLTAIISIFRHRVLIARMALAAVLVTLVVFMVWPRKYTSSASFVMQNRQRADNVSALASQFGIDVPGTSPSQSPVFFAELVQSRVILEKIIDTTYLVGGKRTSGADLFANGGSTPARHRELAIEGLRKAIRTDLSQKTGIVSVSVRTRGATLSQQIAAKLLAEVNRFNTTMRQQEAQAQRDFIQSRQAEMLQELHSAEQDLEDFQSHNRDLRNSPSLQLTEERLQRVVQLRQQVYVTLVSQFENARIEQLRDTPTITAVELPEVPAAPDPRGLATKALLALMFGTLVGVFVSLVRDSWSAALTSDADTLTTYEILKTDVLWDVAHPLRFAKRVVRNS